MNGRRRGIGGPPHTHTKKKLGGQGQGPQGGTKGPGIQGVQERRRPQKHWCLVERHQTPQGRSMLDCTSPLGGGVWLCHTPRGSSMVVCLTPTPQWQMGPARRGGALLQRRRNQRRGGQHQRRWHQRWRGKGRQGTRRASGAADVGMKTGNRGSSRSNMHGRSPQWRKSGTRMGGAQPPNGALPQPPQVMNPGWAR